MTGGSPGGKTEGLARWSEKGGYRSTHSFGYVAKCRIVAKKARRLLQRQGAFPEGQLSRQVQNGKWPMNGVQKFRGQIAIPIVPEQHQSDTLPRIALTKLPTPTQLIKNTREQIEGSPFCLVHSPRSYS